MIRSNATIIGQLNKPDEVIVTLFPDVQNHRRINPHIYRMGNESTPAQKRYNRKISDEKIVNLIMNNFISKDLLITLTYRTEPSSIDEADRELTNFLNKLHKFYRRRGIEISYVAVTEKGDKGRLHHHIIFKKVKDMNYQDIVNRWSRRSNGPLGHVDIEVIKGNHTLKSISENGLDDIYYTARYVTKNPLSPSNKRYKHTEGLIEPVKVSSDGLFTYKEFEGLCYNPDSNEAASLLINKVCPNEDYKLVDRRVNVNWIEQAGHYHLSARLRRQLHKNPYSLDWSIIRTFDETDTVTMTEGQLYKKTYNVSSAIFKTPGIDERYHELDLKANPKSLRGFAARLEKGGGLYVE